nr:ABC transporter arginine-binding protein 1-like [Lytechinus pictus]
MTEPGFKFSRLGAGGEENGSQEAELVPPADSSSNAMTTMMLGDGSGAMGSAKAVRRTTLLLMALVGVICLLSVVLSGLALSRVMSLEPEEKIWTFALGETHLNMHYIDGQTLEMDGFDVEIITSICNTAGKRCRIVTDDYTNCWKSQKGSPARGGDGLYGGWYDGCAGWSQTPERERAFSFTKPYTKAFQSVFYRLTDSSGSFDPSNLEGKKIGFLDGYSNDEHCLNKQQRVQGLPLQKEQIFHYLTASDAEAAMKNNEIDAIYSSKTISYPSSSMVEGRSFNCSSRGYSVMTRKDSHLRDWWNPAWEKIYSSTTYHLMCNTLELRHGKFPGLNSKDICLPYK